MARTGHFGKNQKPLREILFTISASIAKIHVPLELDARSIKSVNSADMLLGKTVCANIHAYVNID
jgi:hypothetical protein